MAFPLDHEMVPVFGTRKQQKRKRLPAETLGVQAGKQHG